MERKNLADYLLEGGAGGEQFITPKGEVYTCLGITPVSEGETKNRKKRMKIKKEGGLEEQVDIDSHLEDSKVAVELAAGKFYEFVSGRKEGKVGKVVYYDGKNLIDEFRNKLDPSKEKGLRPIDNEHAYIEALEGKARYFSEEKQRVDSVSEFMRAYLDRKSDDLDNFLEDDFLQDDFLEEDDTHIMDPLDESLVEEGIPPSSEDATVAEVPLEEIAENADSDDSLFGSSSGLLDLSLQTDDTSLGGILDEIYAPPKPKEEQEIPLEQIEDDVDLDTFGSGSGLLDLALQADDTSLGGILDEIKDDTQSPPKYMRTRNSIIPKPKKKSSFTRVWNWFWNF